MENRDGSAMRKRLEKAFDRFLPIDQLSDGDAAARKIRDEEIDILVNLNGYFGAHRMGIFARRVRRPSRSTIWVSPARWARPIWTISLPIPWCSREGEQPFL